MGDDLLIILSVGFTIFCACGLINECIKDFQHKKRTPKRKSGRTSFRPKVPYSKLINEVVRWSGDLLLMEGINHYPRVKVIYRRHKSVRGRYRSSKNTIELYVHPQIGLKQLIKTTLHEIRHYIQDKNHPDFDNYDRFTRKLGYYENPFEIDSRTFANKHFMACHEYLKTKGFI
jgi:hypothetical protein